MITVILCPSLLDILSKNKLCKIISCTMERQKIKKSKITETFDTFSSDPVFF